MSEVTATAVDRMKARLSTAYALSVYLPMSRAAAVIRSASRRLRGKRSSGVAGNSPIQTVDWWKVVPRGAARLVETKKRHGNVRISELAILAQAAAQAEPGSDIVEIGTFDGRTTLNLAVNAPQGCHVLTLDLPADHATAFAIEASERTLVDKPASGERIRTCSPAWRSYARRITQLFGDSASFDWSRYHGRAGLVFVDGSHAYDYARKDSETALQLVRPGGVVLWHDYGVWPGVTQALDELESRRHLGLVNIKGSSLVFWRAPGADS